MEHYYKVARTRTITTQKEKAKVRFDNLVTKNIPEYKIGDKVVSGNVSTVSN